ncbi:MAG: DUF6212 domain-containing protein [Paracoccus sp. (in: a-proteobacteria)]
MSIPTQHYAILVEPSLAASCRLALPASLGALLVAGDVPPAPGTTCLAAIATPAGRTATQAMLAEHGMFGLPLIEVDPGLTDELSGRVTTLLLERLSRTETEAAESRSTAAMLRRENIATTTRFREIESFLYCLGNPHVSRSLTWEPEGTICDILPETSVVQPLPLNIVSITAIDLWLPELLRNRVHSLGVSLLDSNGNRHELTETHDDLKMGSGWVRFVLGGAVAGDARNCTLVVQNNGPAKLPVGMGVRTPDPRFAAQGEGMPGDQVLALRIWKALAGAEIPDNRAAAVIDPRWDMAARFLAPSSLPRPEIFAMPSSAQDYITADFWENEDAIIVHPSRIGPVCAVIRDVPLRGLRQLTAVVTVGHAQAPTMNFAIGVAPHGALGRDGYWQGCLGPWLHGLPPHGWAQVHCVPAQPIERADIFLATSLVQDMPNDLSWGLFRGFRAVTATNRTGQEAA